MYNNNIWTVRIDFTNCAINTDKMPSIKISDSIYKVTKNYAKIAKLSYESDKFISDIITKQNYVEFSVNLDIQSYKELHKEFVMFHITRIFTIYLNPIDVDSINPTGNYTIKVLQGRNNIIYLYTGSIKSCVKSNMILGEVRFSICDDSSVFNVSVF